MEKEKIDLCVDTLLSMSYEDKRDVHSRVFSIGVLNGIISVNDKLILLSLISLMYLKLREKNPDVTPLKILMQITGQRKDNSHFYFMLEGLSILVEDLCDKCNVADSCGLKTSQEIVSKIKEILNTWLPF